jgi:hypothetical protein
MRSFASAIDKPMLFQIGDELSNLTRHTTISSKAQTSKQRQSAATLSGDWMSDPAPPASSSWRSRSQKRRQSAFTDKQPERSRAFALLPSHVGYFAFTRLPAPTSLRAEPEA